VRSGRETVKQQRRAQREARRQREEAARRRQRRRRWLWGGGGGVVVLALIVAIVFASRANAAPTIDGIQCNTSEGAVTHIHQHLAIYIKGQPFPVPANIGIDNLRGCLFWLHTHSADGVIHLESPTKNTYTLGQFFDIWQTPLSRTQLLTFKANRTHSVRAYVNGRLYRGDPRAIRLTPHERITLEYGPPWVPAPSFTFPAGD
jgi:hypothetical protein